MFQIPANILTLITVNHFLQVLSASLTLAVLLVTGSEFRKTLMMKCGLVARANSPNQFELSERPKRLSTLEEGIELRSPMKREFRNTERLF